MSTLIRDSKIFRPIFKMFRLTADRKFSVVCFIPRLLKIVRPFYVSRLIATIVVNPVNRVFRRWLRSYVIKKLIEVFRPLPTHFNSTLTVCLKHSISRVVASTFCRTPSVVFWRPVLVMFSLSHFAFITWGTRL